MLNNYVIHLKNIIFFKFIFYIFVLLCLLYLVSTNQNQLSIAEQQHKIAEKSFNAAAIKLYSIIDSDNKILDTFKIYQQIVSRSVEDSCNYRNALLGELVKLGEKYNLSESIEVNISQFFDRNNLTIGNNSKIYIKNYEIILKFAAPDYATYLSLIQDAYQLLPPNSLLVATQAQVPKALNPNVIRKLSSTKLPNLVFANLVFHLREIAIK